MRMWAAQVRIPFLELDAVFSVNEERPVGAQIIDDNTFVIIQFFHPFLPAVILDRGPRSTDCFDFDSQIKLRPDSVRGVDGGLAVDGEGQAGAVAEGQAETEREGDQ